MATPFPGSPAPSSQAPAVASTAPQPGHVNLRVTYLVTGNPRPPHALGNISLETTVSRLRERIQAELPEHPSPSEQRLIYQGRPLLHNEATLRDVLRIEAGTEAGPLPYTFHIVIQQQNAVPPPSTANAPAQLPSAPAARPTADLTNPLRAAENSANRLQESLARIQQQIEANRADLRSVQQRIAMQHIHLGGPPNGPWTPDFRSVVQPGPNGQPGPQPFPLNGRLAPPMARGEGNIPTPTVVQSQPPMNPTLNPAAGPPNQRYVHAIPNGLTPPQPNVQQFQGPNGEHMTVVTDQRSFRIPLPRPSSAPGQRPPSQGPMPTIFASNPSALGQAPPAGFPNMPPNGSLAPGHHVHVPFPFSQPRPNLPQPSNVTAWLLSSPTGPQAILFAPGHGYFSSLRPGAAPAQQSNASTQPPTSAGHADAAPPTSSLQTQAADQPNGEAGRALARVNQRHPPPALGQVPQPDRVDNDLFAFLIQRGWLFLRFYLFIFVFSEPGTWKRYLMIVVATVVCLQPRDSPLSHFAMAARRHLDNLIGPPPVVAPPQAVAAGQERPNNAHPTANPRRPANVRGAVPMTPEEAASRILHERGHRGRSAWRDAFYRAEQSTALFLASLIPGVGERHVRAREEARREEQRQQEEQRRAEEAAAVQTSTQAEGDDPSHIPENGSLTTFQAEPDVKVEGPEEQSHSSSVQVRENGADSGDLRNRTA